MFNSVDYLTKKATFKQVNPDIPITQEIPDSEDPKVFEGESRQEGHISRYLCFDRSCSSPCDARKDPDHLAYVR